MLGWSDIALFGDVKKQAYFYKINSEKVSIFGLAKGNPSQSMDTKQHLNQKEEKNKPACIIFCLPDQDFPQNTNVIFK